MQLSEFTYNLPKQLIAKYPCKNREKSRLMVLDRFEKKFKHKSFQDIVCFLNPGDILVINKTKVIPARLFGRKVTGGKVEVLLLEKPTKGENEVLTKSNSKIKEGEKVIFNDNLQGVILDAKNKVKKMKFSVKNDESLVKIINKLGTVPLPPYIKREPLDKDKNTYQTVYAEVEGSIAAPTAGLHFSKHILDRIRKKGVIIADITLHVSYATFNPVVVKDIIKHKMHKEYFSVSKKTLNILEKAKQKKSRIIAVGTTSCRVLETIANLTEGQILDSKFKNDLKGWTDLFIYPGYVFKLTDALITNFHFPKSTLLLLVCAFSDRDFILNAYKEAIKKRYRFFSYGDCMIIL